ncbi:MAG: bifunctional adenosylcobinamide kinase/adenosylcobinamide-phosphate guanylyltransferase [Armatimonadota bacterium]
MTQASQLILILGGARSGKSTFAERLAAQRGARITYLATATPGDDEMAERIARHQAERSPSWRTVECPLDPAAAIRAHAHETDCFLLDCATLLVSNLLLSGDAQGACAADAPGEETVRRALDALLTAYREAGTDLLIVSNEVGLGLVPEYPLGRLYRDVLGRFNQQAVAAADAVYFLVAGLPLELKSLACSPLTHPMMDEAP